VLTDPEKPGEQAQHRSDDPPRWDVRMIESGRRSKEDYQGAELAVHE
jgi:hypothetical protein